MPSTMIHLLTAHKHAPDGPGFFWVGCFAPDHTTTGRKKTPFTFDPRPIDGRRWPACMR